MLIKFDKQPLVNKRMFPKYLNTLKSYSIGYWGPIICANGHVVNKRVISISKRNPKTFCFPLGNMIIGKQRMILEGLDNVM